MEQIKERECGACTYTVTQRKKYIGEKKENWFNGKPWSQLRKESILVPAEESYAPMVAHIINSCKARGCDKEITKFKVKIDSMEKIREIENKKILEK
jgi:hypothetical protein